MVIRFFRRRKYKEIYLFKVLQKNSYLISTQLKPFFYFYIKRVFTFFFFLKILEQSKQRNNDKCLKLIFIKDIVV